MLNDLFSLQGRVALVTGGSRGIGKMIARGFIAQGAKVYITARKAGPCEATAKELSAGGGQCIAIPIDISTVAGAQKLASRDQAAGAKTRHPRQQRRRRVGRRLRRLPRERLGQGDEPEPEGAVLPDAGAARAAEGGRERRAAGQDHQHRIDRRHLRQSARDLFLSRKQGWTHPSDPAHGRALRVDAHQRHGDCARAVCLGHEPRCARSWRCRRAPGAGRAGSAATTTWREPRSSSPRGPATTLWARRWRSMAALPSAAPVSKARAGRPNSNIVAGLFVHA